MGSVPRRRNLPLWVGTALLGIYLLIAVLGPSFTPYDPNAQDLIGVLECPSREIGRAHV